MALVIAPGAARPFRLDVSHGVATSTGCATAYALQVIPPNDTATLRTTIPSGAYECKDANVSPLRTGEPRTRDQPVTTGRRPDSAARPGRARARA